VVGNAAYDWSVGGAYYGKADMCILRLYLYFDFFRKIYIQYLQSLIIAHHVQISHLILLRPVVSVAYVTHLLEGPHF